MAWALLLFSVFINIQEILIVKIGWGWISYVDEVFLLSAYGIVPLVVRKREDAWVYLILLLPFLSILYSLIFNVFVLGEARTFQVVVQSFINFKFFLYFATFYSVWLASRGEGRFKYIFMVCFLVSMLGYVLNIIYPDFFVFSDAAWHIERGRIAGFQFKPNDLALFFSLSCLLVLFSGLNCFLRFGGFFVLILLIYFTSSRTALAFSLMAFAFYLFRNGGAVLLMGVVIAIVGGGAFFYDEISESFIVSETVSNLGEFSRIESSQYIRGIMIYLSFVLAVDYFPVGVGAGGFGSVMSAGSPVYDILGVANNDFFIELSGVYDSGFASVLGEYGFLGLFLYLFLLFKIVLVSINRGLVGALFIFFMIVMLFLVQPFFSYQVNAVNVLLLLFSLREIYEGRRL